MASILPSDDEDINGGMQLSSFSSKSSELVVSIRGGGSNLSLTSTKASIKQVPSPSVVVSVSSFSPRFFVCWVILAEPSKSTPE